jgi:predicted N-acetyltransferase YhbS
MSEIEVRGATRQDYPAVAAVLGNAFGQDELDLWHYIVANDPTIDPDGVRIALVDGQLVACTVVVPRPVMTRAGWQPGAIITLVACDPAFQRSGFGGMTVRSALAYCRSEGLGVAVLYGVPEYYPRFGYVPVLPRLTTEMPAEAALAAAKRSLFGGRGPGDVPRLAPFAASDIPAAAALYRQALATYPMAVDRLETTWAWQFRPGKDGSLGVLKDAQGRLCAYARLERDSRDAAAGLCHEAAVAESCWAVPLFAALAQATVERGFERLRFILPPDHLIVQAAILLGAEQVYRPATAGMAAIVDWAAVLPAPYTVIGDEGGPSSVRPQLHRGGRPLLRARRELLVQLALGYRGFDDLCLLPEVEQLGDDGDAAKARSELDRLYPRWTLAPYW